MEQKVTINNFKDSRNYTIHAAVALAIYQLLFIIFIAPKISIVWFLLPLLATLFILSHFGYVTKTLSLCYTVVCLFLLAEPSVNISHSIWLVLILYFIILEKKEKSIVLGAYGLWTGILIASGIYSWLLNSMVSFFEFGIAPAIMGFLLIVFLIGMQHSLFLMSAIFFRKRFSLPICLLIPALYTLFEYWMPLPFPIALSLAFVNRPFFIQSADILGMFGASLVIAAGTSAVYFLIKACVDKNYKKVLIGIIITIIVFTFQFGYGYWSYGKFRGIFKDDCIDIAMIQPVAPLKIKNSDVKLQIEISAEIKDLIYQSLQGYKEKPDLILIPEGAGSFASQTPSFNPPYMSALMDVQRETSTTLLVQDIEFTRNVFTGKLQYYSTASLIKPVGIFAGSYKKNILMPFGEYLPMESSFPILRKLLPEARSILHGETAEPIATEKGKAATLICYEILFPNYVRKIVNNDCRYIVNLTNDRWYGIRQQPIQHQGMAVLRAIENRKPVARSTNSGISAFIDSCGRVAAENQTKIMAKTFLRGSIQPNNYRTFYSRHGDILHPYIFTPLYLVLAVYGIAKSNSNSKRATKIKLKSEMKRTKIKNEIRKRG